MKLFIFLTVLGTQIAEAKVSVKNTQPVQIPQAETAEMKSADIARIIPTDMKQSDDSAYVATKIGDHAIQNWLNSPTVKNSSFGRTADKVNNSMKTEVAVKSNDSQVEHKFTFQVMALQAISQFKYTGWLNAALNFDARAKETKLELSEKFWNGKDFVISHTSTAEQASSAVGLRWSW